MLIFSLLNRPFSFIVLFYLCVVFFLLKFYFQASFNVNVILYMTKITKKLCDV